MLVYMELHKLFFQVYFLQHDLRQMLRKNRFSLHLFGTVSVNKPVLFLDILRQRSKISLRLLFILVLAHENLDKKSFNI
jgi:hypothetical protein